MEDKKFVVFMNPTDASIIETLEPDVSNGIVTYKGITKGVGIVVPLKELLDFLTKERELIEL